MKHLHHYYIFLTVAQELSFSRAANVLHMTQSGVSQSIAQLEDQLQTKLFIRSTKKVQLTHDGQVLLKHVTPAIRLIEQGEHQLERFQQLDSGHIHIGVSDTICRYFLLPYLERFHRLYPDIDIQITNRTSMDCVTLLKNNDVDFIVSNLPNPKVDKHMHIQPVKTFSDIFVAPASMIDRMNTPLSLTDLSQFPILFLDTTSSTTQFMMQLFEEYGIERRPSIELGSVDVMIDMCKIGLGITMVPDYVLSRQKGDLVPIPVNFSIKKRELGIIYQTSLPLTYAGRAFIKEMTLPLADDTKNPPPY